MKNYQTIILSNLEISPGYWRMRILAPGFAKTASPGQFVMLRPEQQLPTMLRRPFGIFRTGCLPPECAGLPPREYMEILYKVVGQGTRIMSELLPATVWNCSGPSATASSSTTTIAPNCWLAGVSAWCRLHAGQGADCPRGKVCVC